MPEGQFSPLRLLMQATVEEVARQLTMIDFRVFSSIQSTELLNLSWSNPRRQHLAANVLAMINRSNNLAFWYVYVCLCVDWRFIFRDSSVV